MAASLVAMEIPGLPPKKLNGEWNPAYFAALLDWANNCYIDTVLVRREKSDFNYAQLQKGVLDAAKLVGIAEREIIDRRTPEQRAEDVWKLISADPESMFGVKDEDLKALDRVIALKEERMNDADRLSYEALEEILVKEEDERDERSHIGKAGREAIAGARSPKAWRRRIARVLRLRQRAKMKVPPNGTDGGWTGNQHTERNRPGLIPQALEAARFLRFMVYTGRVGVEMGEQFAKRESNPESLIFDISKHHCVFAASLWIHRSGAMPVYDKEIGKYKFVPGMVPYQGSMQVMPVGHCKTEMAIHYAGAEIGDRPRTQAYYVHAKHERAKKGVQAIKRFFDEKDPIGQRYLSLFPLSLAKVDNDATHIRVKVKNPPKSPTFTAAGVDSSELGGDSDFQIWDDVVPQSDASEESTRKRRYEILAGTFLTRQRGRNTFVLVIGTFWHYGDALMTILARAKLAAKTNGQQGMMFGVQVQRCGGPKPTEKTKAWQALWPKNKGEFELKLQYGSLGPSLYSAAFMSNPISDEQRVVKKLRLYDPMDPVHQSFLHNSVKYISLDPAATKESKSDKAGIVYAGMGDVRVVKQIDGIEVHDTEKRVRLFNYHEIHATQSDLTEYVLAFAKHREVGYVLVEAVNGFKGIVEMFYGLKIDAIPLSPRGKDKKTRLMSVAVALEDISANLGFRAICEWPGVRNDKGELELHPDFKGLAEQILDFGVCASDHGCDALSYLLGHLSPDLNLGRGIVSESVKRVEQEFGDPRLLAHYKAYERAEKLNRDGTSEQQEDAWMKRNWS